MANTNILEKSVLVVEDSLELNRMFCKQLKGRGFFTEGVTSVAEASVYLNQDTAPALIILDLELLDGSGTEILELLNSAAFRNTKVVVVSGDVYGHKAKIGHYRVDYALLKPVSPRALATLVSSLVI